MPARSEAVDARALQAAEARAEAALAQAAQERELRRTAEARIREEMVATFRPLREELRAAEARVDQLKAVLAEAREQHAEELAAQRQEHADALAEMREQHAIEFRVQDAHHELEVADVLAGQPSASRGVQAEAGHDQAGSDGSEWAAERRRLQAEAARWHAEFEHARREHLAARRELEQVTEELDRVTQERDALAQRLAPPPDPGPLVAVQWLKDSPVEGCRINDATYRGRGPRFHRRPLLVGGHQTEHSSTEIETIGEAHAVPEGAARVLAQAGFVRILNPVVSDMPAPQPRPTSLQGLRDEAAALTAHADALERAAAAEQEAEQDPGAGEAEQVERV